MTFEAIEMECSRGHRYLGIDKRQEGLPCYQRFGRDERCGEPVMNIQPTRGDRVESETSFGESSAAEHWPLKPGDGGSNPPPRTTSDDPCDECGHRHTSAAVAEDHRASFKGRTPPFEGEDGGSTPPARSTPELRRGYEITLENGTTVGWFHTRTEQVVVSIQGQVLAAFAPREWWAFLDYAHADAADRRPAAEFSLCEEGEGYRVALAEALQALEESTAVVERQTDEIANLNGTVNRLLEQNATLNAENHRLAQVNDRLVQVNASLRAENRRLSRTEPSEACDRRPCTCGYHRDRT